MNAGIGKSVRHRASWLGGPCRRWSTGWLLRLAVLAGAMAGSVSAATRADGLAATLDRAKKLERSGPPAQLLAIAGQIRNPELADLALWLEGEARRALGDGPGALAAYRKILKTHPETQAAFKVGLPMLLLECRDANPQRFRELRGVAMILPTAYQRGRALTEVAKLAPDVETRAATLVEAMRAYRSESDFHQKTPDVGTPFLVLVSDNLAADLDAETWLWAVMTAIRQGHAAAVKPRLAAINAKLATPLAAVLVGAAISASEGQKAMALRRLSEMAADRQADTSVRLWACRLAGEMSLESGDHLGAAKVFAIALTLPAADPEARIECLNRRMRSLFRAGDDAGALVSAGLLLRDHRDLSVLPGQLYEMALERLDAGQADAAAPWFLLLARHFPEHYRADDALGYLALTQPQHPDVANIRQRLEFLYPHSFFVRWLQPDRVFPPLKPAKVAISPVSPRVQRWQKRWHLLAGSEYRDWSREEMDRQLARNPDDLALLEVVVKVLVAADDGFRLTAVAEKAMRRLQAAERSPLGLPAWLWHAAYPRPYWARVQQEAARYQIDPYLVLAIMREESHFNPTILSRSNAHGLMQILPSTGKWIAGKLGIKKFRNDDLWSTDTNIAFGSWYLRYLLDFFAGNLPLAVAAYNGGQGNLKRKVEEGPFRDLPLWERLDRVPMQETRDYYKKVIGSLDTYHRLYLKEGAPPLPGR